MTAPNSSRFCSSCLIWDVSRLDCCHPACLLEGVARLESASGMPLGPWAEQLLEGLAYIYRMSWCIYWKSWPQAISALVPPALSSLTSVFAGLFLTPFFSLLAALQLFALLHAFSQKQHQCCWWVWLCAAAALHCGWLGMAVPSMGQRWPVLTHSLATRCWLCWAKSSRCEE